MSVNLESTTDTPEEVMAATGKLSAEEDVSKEEKESAPTVKNQKGEKATEDSDTSEDESDQDSEDESDQDSEDESDEDEVKDDDTSKPKKSRGGFKRRIDKLSREREDARREAQYWREQALKSAKPQDTDNAPPEKSEPKVDGAPKKPVADDFDSFEEFAEALTDWKIEQREAKRAEKERIEQSKTAYQKQIQTFQEKVQEFAKSVEDYNEVIEDVADVVLSPGLHEAVTTSDLGPALLYELAKNSAELERINALSPIACAREIGKLEDRIQARSSEKPKKPTTTKAPPPITPVGSKGTNASSKSPDQMSYQEYKKWREANS